MTPTLPATDSLWSANAFSAKRGKYLLLAAALFLLIMAVSRLTTEDIGKKAGDIAIVLGTLGLLIYNRRLLNSTVFYLLGAALAAQTITWALSQSLLPEMVEKSAKLHRMGAWFTMIPLAYILGGRLRNVLVLWGVATLGIVIAPWITGGGWTEIIRGLSGIRVDFDLHNAQHAATLYGTCLLGLLCLAKRSAGQLQLSDGWRFAMWITAVVLCCTAIIITQTRAIWLGLAAALAVLAIYYGLSCWKKYRLGQQSPYRIVATFSLLAACLIATGWQFQDMFKKRFVLEAETISNIVSGEHQFTQWDNASIRFATWLEAKNWIAEKPIFGWGGKGRKHVVDSTPDLPEAFKSIHHLHNSYLDTIVNYGLVGLSVMLAVFGLLIYAAHFAWRAGTLPSDMYAFFGSFIIFWLVINCFESYMYYSSGKFIFGLISGGVLTLYWKARYGNEYVPEDIAST